MGIRLALLVALCAWPLQAAADTLIHVRIDTPQARTVASELTADGFDVLEGSISKGSLELIVSSAELKLLEQQGYAPVTLAHSRPFREIEKQRASMGVPAGYPDLGEVMDEMYAAEAAYPGICRVVDVTTAFGTSETFEGRRIFGMKISDNVDQDEDEPVFMLVSCHHAREIVTPVIALHAIEQFTSQYGVDPQITALVDEYEIWAAPVWNPDGYVHVFNVNNMWRKNRRVFAGGTGVDLNRNYPFGWYSPCSGSTNPSSETYKGPSPASEAETQTMIAVSDARHFCKVIDYHSSGRIVLYAYDCLDHPFETYLRNEAIAISSASGYGGDSRPPSADGEHYQWQLGMKGGYAFLEETHTTFQPSYASAQAEAAMVFPGMLYMLERAIPLSGRVTDAATGAPLEAAVTLVGVNFQNDEENQSGGPFGRYHVFASPAQYQVEFSATDYITQTHTVNITSSAQVLDVALVPDMVGDLNCDGILDAFDIDPFVLALTNPGEYTTQYPDCYIYHGDINGDGLLDAFDIDPFVLLLTGG